MLLNGLRPFFGICNEFVICELDGAVKVDKNYVASPIVNVETVGSVNDNDHFVSPVLPVLPKSNNMGVVEPSPVCSTIVQPHAQSFIAAASMKQDYFLKVPVNRT